jgi:hypothetical protein
MKKRIGYLLLIIISIVGSRLIFGKDYHLNSDNLKDSNLYVYKDFDKGSIITTFVDNEDFYYVSKINKNQYSVVKYNLINDSKEAEYLFNNSNNITEASLFKQDGHIYLISTNNDYYYKFDKKLNMLAKATFNVENLETYGIYRDKLVYTINNGIYYENKLYAEVPASCGKSKEIIYDRDTYFHFYNENTGFGCLYNLDDKKIEYLDYANAFYVKDKLLEYQYDRLSFKFDGSTYYFNDITETNNIKMHDSGDYLFTIDMTNNKLRVYNIESRKIIYEKKIDNLKGSTVSNILIDDYVFFLLNDGTKTDLYVWDYLKETRSNYDMIDYNEKEYKFKNNELKEEIRNNYNIDVYLYDQAVDYFDKYYVLASYDDILINSRLLTIKEVLQEFNSEEVANIKNIKLYFEKDIVSSNGDNKPVSLLVNKNNSNILVINITNDAFKDTIKKELINLYPNLEKNIELGK